MKENTLKPFTPRHTAKQILTPQSRGKIKFAVNGWDDDGLYGQFPELSGESEVWKDEVKVMLKKAQKVLVGLHGDPEFHGLFRSSDRINMGWTTNEVLMQAVDPPRGWRIWCVNLGDNHNLALIFTQNKELIITTDQFQHMDDHPREFHWLLRHDGKLGGSCGLKTDSHRLFMALKVLSDPEKAKAYLRARLHHLETLSD